MSKWKMAEWWAYVIGGIVLLFFLGPALISAHDTFAVLFGVLLFVLFGIWSWELWIKSVINKLEELQ